MFFMCSQKWLVGLKCILYLWLCPNDDPQPLSYIYFWFSEGNNSETHKLFTERDSRSHIGHDSIKFTRKQKSSPKRVVATIKNSPKMAKTLKCYQHTHICVAVAMLHCSQCSIYKHLYHYSLIFQVISHRSPALSSFCDNFFPHSCSFSSSFRQAHNVRNLIIFLRNWLYNNMGNTKNVRIEDKKSWFRLKSSVICTHLS